MIAALTQAFGFWDSRVGGGVIGTRRTRCRDELRALLRAQLAELAKAEAALLGLARAELFEQDAHYRVVEDLYSHGVNVKRSAESLVRVLQAAIVRFVQQQEAPGLMSIGDLVAYGYAAHLGPLSVMSDIDWHLAVLRTLVEQMLGIPGRDAESLRLSQKLGLDVLTNVFREAKLGWVNGLDELKSTLHVAVAIADSVAVVCGRVEVYKQELLGRFVDSLKAMPVQRQGQD